MDEMEIERRLKALPHKARVAFAARMAIRVLPFLSWDAQPVGLALASLRQKTIFRYWQEDKRQMHLFAVLQAQLLSIGFALSNSLELDDSLCRSRSPSAAADAADDAIVYANAASDAAYAAANAAAYAGDLAYGDVPSHALAIVLAAKRIMRYFTEEEADIVWQHCEFDLQTLERLSIPELLHAPLWQDTAPESWHRLWQKFSAQVMALEPSFSIWLTWLEARIAGKTIDLDLLEKWLILPPEVKSQSPAAINQYLANLAQASTALNHVRTIFIGYGEAGKTSLIRTLHGEPVVEGKETMTPGIEIREWKGAAEDLITHFWDFGGQVMAHATHQFFLRSSCLYVLVLSARAEVNATEQAEYWLQHVQAFGGKASVLIVGNKHDQTQVHIDLASLQAKYPNIRGFYPISCTQAQTDGAYQHKFQAFRADFCEQLSLVGTHQVQFTARQFSFLNELRRRAANQAFLAHTEFDALCEEYGIGKGGGQSKENFLDLLDKLGIIIHFKDLPYLSEHVLNPRWLTYGVYTVMYAKRARLNLLEIVGLLSKAEVRDEQGQVLRYPAEKCHFIATAMCYFKLCYRLPGGQERYIIPCLLDTDQPAALQQAQFDKSLALAYKVVFTGFVPRHVMPEFIVENNEAIVNQVVWQYGVLLDHRESRARALAQVDYQAREFTLWISGPDARDYLNLLREDLLRILSRLTMKYEEQIRLPAEARLSQGLSGDVRGELREDDWAGYKQFVLCQQDGDEIFKSVSGLKYDLKKVAGVYLKPVSSPAGGIHNHFYNHVDKLNQLGAGMAGDKNIHMHGGTVQGSLVNADQIQGSFNVTNNHDNPALASALQQLLAEITALNAKIPAAQVAPIAEEAQTLLAETQRAEPRQRWYQASLEGIISAAQKLGEVGVPLLEIAEKVKEHLGL